MFNSFLSASNSQQHYVATIWIQAKSMRSVKNYLKRNKGKEEKSTKRIFNIGRAAKIVVVTNFSNYICNNKLISTSTYSIFCWIVLYNVNNNEIHNRFDSPMSNSMKRERAVSHL